jgi:hypothetical protein
MSEGGISHRVRTFIAHSIDAAELLDTLALVHSAPERERIPDEVARAIFTVPAGAIMRLEQLVHQGLAASTGGANPIYRYAPATAVLREQVDMLDSAYRTNRVAVVNLVYQRQRDPLRDFSDAFRLRRD